MSSVPLETPELMLPSQALNRPFELPDGLLPGQSATDAEAERFNAHAVRVGNIGLLLPRDRISELIEQPAVCRLPNTSTWFDGIMSVRGNMIPVFDLHQLFDIAPAAARRRLIVVGENDRAVAFWADDYPRLLSLDDGSVFDGTPPLPVLIRDHARRYYLDDDQVWVDWNIETFVTTLGKMI